MTKKDIKQPEKVVKLPMKKGVIKEIGYFVQGIYHKMIDSKIKNISPLSSEYAIGFINRNSFLRKTKILATSIKHSDTKVVLKGLNKLSKIKSKETKCAIKACISHRDPKVVLSAIEHSKMISDDDIIAPLRECLYRTNKKIALQALWSLAEIKTPKAICVIEEALNIQDDEINRVAEWVLKGLGSKRRKMRA